MKKIVLAVVTAVGLMVAASTAQAVPFVVGSFAFSEFTSTTTNVTTTTSFALGAQPSLVIGSPTGDFTTVVLPAALAQANPLNFLVPASLDWTNATLGTFHAVAAVLADSGTVGPNGFATWNVLGTFTVGAGFTNTGDVLSADETWSLTQTGGPGNAISLSGTFHSPQTIIKTPEPATLTLLGLGVALAGLLAMRRKTVV